MRRVLVIGCSGAGKSTLSRQLSRLTGLPMISLDAEFWQPGWVEMAQDDWRRRVRELATGERWIMDGTYVTTLDLRLPRADTVLWFDYPRRICMARALWRSLTTYGQVRAEMAPGCPEKLDPEFFHYIWTFDRHYRHRIASALVDFGAHLRPVIIRHDAAARDFFDKVVRDSSAKRT